MERFFKANLLNKILIVCVKYYQNFISPVTGSHCRFYPSCSSYYIEALQSFNVVKATMLFVIRILKCHPFHPGGYDPLPEGKNK
ncbi:MAG: membrane protein insertion efficiency factor YidD [Candidatus Omnitrophica bacterium]|nr:membrane protein insertion efficiency factor YidD [Candidatus Omnitrophota bacterium]